MPAINNLLPDAEKAPLPRELKNIKVFFKEASSGFVSKALILEMYNLPELYLVRQVRLISVHYFSLTADLGLMT